MAMSQELRSWVIDEQGVFRRLRGSLVYVYEASSAEGGNRSVVYDGPELPRPTLLLQPGSRRTGLTNNDHSRRVEPAMNGGPNTAFGRKDR